jgi:hypothetical protein
MAQNLALYIRVSRFLFYFRSIFCCKEIKKERRFLLKIILNKSTPGMCSFLYNSTVLEKEFFEVTVGRSVRPLKKVKKIVRTVPSHVIH